VLLVPCPLQVPRLLLVSWGLLVSRRLLGPVTILMSGRGRCACAC
jgi:hypothetical protein